MSATKKLKKVLRGLFALIEEEANQNSDFAERLQAVVADFDTSGGKPGAKGGHAGKSKKTLREELPDIFEQYAKLGNEEFYFWLRTLDLVTLKSLVSANGFDPEKRVNRWADKDKIIALLSEKTEFKLKRGSAFLE